jgi:hypothetical protein
MLHFVRTRYAFKLCFALLFFALLVWLVALLSWLSHRNGCDITNVTMCYHYHCPQSQNWLIIIVVVVIVAFRTTNRYHHSVTFVPFADMASAGPGQGVHVVWFAWF